MHGQKNIKLCNAEQAKRAYQYKNIKIELYKNNAAIWFNKICRTRHLTPESALHLHTVRLFTEVDDTRGCGDTIGPPEEEQRAARNMLRIVV
jgi:hypothetical protein